MTASIFAAMNSNVKQHRKATALHLGTPTSPGIVPPRRVTLHMWYPGVVSSLLQMNFLWKVKLHPLVNNKRVLHLIHLSINSVLSKINRLRIITINSRASVIGITESKLNRTVLDGEINIDGYELVRSDQNRHGSGMASYVRNDISFNLRCDFSNEI